MIENNQTENELAWEELRQKSRRRQRTARRRLASPVLIILLALGILGFVIGFGAASQSKPLVLPETVQVHALTLADCVEPLVEDFVTGLEDTGIEVSFRQNPDNEKLGGQEITLEFTKEKQSCTVATQLYRFALTQSVTVNQGETNADIRAFVADETVNASFGEKGPESIGQDQVGSFELQIVCDGRTYPVQYMVSETIPPQGVGKQVQVEAGTMPEASEFVEQIVDHTPVTVTYQQEPKFVQVGEQKITLVLTDAFGNTATVEATATVVPAENGPQYSGLTTLRSVLGSAISYKTGVSFTDKQDGELKFTVDAAQVDIQTAGTYTVYYTAVDADGNELVVPRTIIIYPPSNKGLDGIIQETLAEIIKPGMTISEQVAAMYRQVRFSTFYSGNSDKSSIELAAYEGFTKHTGDCYTYYSMMKVLLDAMGIENLEVTRVGGNSRHWWNLVKMEDGKYYFVDASPGKVSFDWLRRQKMTASDIERYTNHKDVIAHRVNYYTYDKTLPQYQGLNIAQ